MTYMYIQTTTLFFFSMIFLLRSIISTCSTKTPTDTVNFITLPPPSMPPENLFSDTSSLSEATTSSHDSLHSSLSLQTLPSVLSLQTLPSETVATSSTLQVTHLCLDSLSLKHVPISVLAIHRHFLYAAFAHEVHVIDTRNGLDLNDVVDIFNRDSESSGSVKAIKFCDEKVLTAHQDGRICVWKLSLEKRHKHVATLPTPKDYFRNFIFPQSYVKVRRHRTRLWIEHDDAVSGLATNGDNNLLFSVSWDRSLKIWRTSDFKCLESIRIHDDAINAIVVGPDGLVYTASADRRIKVWGQPVEERNSKKYNYKHVLIATLEKHKSPVNALALNTKGNILFSGACDRSILVWEREDSANHMVVSGALRGHSKAILCLINVCDLLFSGSADRTVRIWQRGCDRRFCCLSVLDGHEKPVKALAAVKEDESDGSSGLKVFSGSFDGEIKVSRVVVSNLNNTQHSTLTS